MRLVAARITKFKSVTNSTEFDLAGDVTALVGKNESGKTASLEALYRLNPLSSGHPTDFDELYDYPRRYRSRDKATIPSVEPIKATFELEQPDIEEIANLFGPKALTRKTVTVCKKYSSKTRYFGIAVDEFAAAKHLAEKAGLDSSRYAANNIDEFIAALRADADADAAVSLADDLDERDLSAEVRAIVAERLPEFQYFDEYNVLPDEVSIERLQNVPEADLRPEERTALALLRLAGVETADFTEDEYESRKAALESAANELTDQLFEYWQQNSDLLVELDIDPRKEPTPNNPNRTVPWLKIRIKNQRHRVTLGMGGRSKGFIWFFSFLVAFSEYANHASRRIILLDEPGLNLHAKAQADLLRYIEEQLAPYHQVIYSTHSLFMIQPTKLERCRTVEDINNDGTQISQDIWKARSDTVYPLLGALGVDMTQTLVIGKEQLLVEGPSDVVYLSIMSDVVRRAGGVPLDPRWTITPVGGLDKVPSFVSLFGGSDLSVAVLMDVAAGGNQRIAQLATRGLLENRNLVYLTEITGTSEADIEDLFDVSWYLKLLSASKVGRFAKSKLNGGGRIVKQVEALHGGRFDHYQPANHLMRSPGNLLDQIDDATRDRFQDLFNRLNQLL
ncbi:AAA family ATPase [Nocardia puris]|uniref:AAA family ATPase n=1 Tax=Nocardia puris TaxID=208602 RepID=UPI001895C0DC|nr:AAA family ATPase [Nocardia puris]MBF6216274.1 AAA family ATPase [Nocardia puris]MBF6368933.1 AAA family ATPase [Nocardia puris]MBF6462919.1 AAA family ATPase [Nocardia puris]